MISGPPEERVLRLSEVKNAIDYLDKTASYIKTAPENYNDWKWVIISLHGALYGFAISACQGIDCTSVINKNGRLISIWEALKRCQDPKKMKMLGMDKHLVLSESQKKSIEMLVSEFRNEFQHFQPQGWSIEIHGMPQMAIDVLEVIYILALETRTYIHLNDNEQTLIHQHISDSISNLKESELYKKYLLGRKLYEE